MLKKGVLIFGLLVFSFFLVNFVSAEELVSDVGVQYEERILKEFEENDLVDVIIDPKNISDKENILSDFLEDEIGRVINRQESRGMAVEITQEAFFKLIQDERVESVYYNAPVYGISDSNTSFFKYLIIFLLILTCIIIGFIIYKYKKRKRENAN